MRTVPVWIVIQSSGEQTFESAADRKPAREAPYDFTYVPSTVHITRDDQLKFVLHPVAPVPNVWVVFDVPVEGQSFSLSVKRTEAKQGDPPDKRSEPLTLTIPMPDAEGTTLRASMLPKGTHHYRVVGVTEHGELVADMYCPSIIVN